MENKKDSKFDIWRWIFIVLLIVSMVTSGILAWNQLWYPEKFGSDLYFHVMWNLSKPGLGYSFLSCMIEGLYSATGENMHVTLSIWTVFLSLCNGASVLLMCYSYTKLYRIRPNKWVYFFSLASIYVTAFFSRYLRASYANVWHNTTMTLLRPCSICVVLFTCLALRNYSEGEKTGKYIVLNAIATFIAMWIKPTFLAVFLPAMCILFCIELIEKRGKNIGFLLKLGASNLVIIPIFLFQYIHLYSKSGVLDRETSNIYIKTSWSYEQVVDVLGALCRSSVFVVIGMILLLVYHKTNWKIQIVCWSSFVIANVYKIFFRESGPRENDGNFCWSAVSMLFFLTAIIVGEVFIKPSNKKIPVFWRIVLGGIYAGLLYSGLVSFWVVYNGGTYV